MMSPSVLKTCLSHTSQASDLDCSTVQASRSARELIERSASNVKTALSSSLVVASFVEKWASKIKDAAELIKNKNVDALLDSLDESVGVLVMNLLSKDEIPARDSTSFFRILLDVLRATHLLKTIDAETENLKKNINCILKEKVICPKACSAAESEARTLLRMNYHVWDASQSYEGYSPMNKLYPELWA
ncbi:unnamed protein product, partial [Caenorhabditis auriculariae]